MFDLNFFETWNELNKLDEARQINPNGTIATFLGFYEDESGKKLWLTDSDNYNPLAYYINKEATENFDELVKKPILDRSEILKFNDKVENKNILDKNKTAHSIYDMCLRYCCSVDAYMTNTHQSKTNLHEHEAEKINRIIVNSEKSAKDKLEAILLTNRYATEKLNFESRRSSAKTNDDYRIKNIAVYKERLTDASGELLFNDASGELLFNNTINPKDYIVSLYLLNYSENNIVLFNESRNGLYRKPREEYFAYIYEDPNRFKNLSNISDIIVYAKCPEHKPYITTLLAMNRNAYRGCEDCLQASKGAQSSNSEKSFCLALKDKLKETYGDNLKISMASEGTGEKLANFRNVDMFFSLNGKDYAIEYDGEPYHNEKCKTFTQFTDYRKVDTYHRKYPNIKFIRVREFGCYEWQQSGVSGSYVNRGKVENVGGLKTDCEIITIKSSWLTLGEKAKSDVIDELIYNVIK